MNKKLIKRQRILLLVDKAKRYQKNLSASIIHLKYLYKSRLENTSNNVLQNTKLTPQSLDLREVNSIYKAFP